MKKKINTKQKDYKGWELHNFDSADNFRKYQFKLLKKYISGKVAEIGPGNGKLVKNYYNLADKINLFEPSKNLSKNLKKKFKSHKKLNIFEKNFTPKTNYYNCIMYLDVIEHIKNDKLEIFKALKSLKKNGYLLINVPAFQILYSDFDKDVGHFRRYDKLKILKLLNNSKYSRLNMFYYDSIGFFLSLLSKFLFRKNYKDNFSSKIKIWDRLIPISYLLDKIFLNLIGKSLFIVIKK